MGNRKRPLSKSEYLGFSEKYMPSPQDIIKASIQSSHILSVLLGECYGGRSLNGKAVGCEPIGCRFKSVRSPYLLSITEVTDNEC